MEIITRINWVDVLAIIICLRIGYISFQDGLSHGIFPLIGAIVSLIFTFHYYNKIALFISQNLAKIPIEISSLLSFVILIAAISFLFKGLRVFLDKIIKVTWHPVIEKFGGLAVGIARALVVASTVLIIIALIPLSYLQWSIRDRALTGMHFLKIGPSIYEKAAKFLPTIKVEGASISRDAIVKQLVADKSISPRPKKVKDKTPEWEKVTQF